MIFFSKIFLGSVSVGAYKRADISMSSIEWLGRLKRIATLMSSPSWYSGVKCFFSSTDLRCSPNLVLR